MPGLGSWTPSNVRNAFKRMASGAGADNLKTLIALAGNPAMVGYWDDFVGSPTGTWPANANWMYPATVGTGTEVIGITAGLGGTLTCTTGGTNGNGAYQTFGLNWRGTEGVYYIARVKIDSIATAKWEAGLTDSLTAEGAIATKATPTFTATNCAVFAFDTSDDTNITFITANGGVVGANADSVVTLAADTYVTLEIRVLGGFAVGYVNGIQCGAGGAISATAPLTPYVGATTRATATRTLTCDFQGAVGPRIANY